jgi:hypothetical protein
VLLVDGQYLEQHIKKLLQEDLCNDVFRDRKRLHRLFNNILISAGCEKKIDGSFDFTGEYLISGHYIDQSANHVLQEFLKQKGINFDIRAMKKENAFCPDK